MCRVSCVREEDTRGPHIYIHTHSLDTTFTGEIVTHHTYLHLRLVQEGGADVHRQVVVRVVLLLRLT